MRSWKIALLAGIALLAAGCGGDEEPVPSPVPERQEETSEKLPKLPRGFEPYANQTAGIVFGRPPGWDVAEKGVLTVICSPDELVVLSVSADRTDQALAGEPAKAAGATAEILAGYRKPLKPSKAKPFRHHYDAASVRASGVSEDGVKQDVEVIVLEREGATVVTAVLASNASKTPKDELKQADEALASLRTKPPG